MRSEFGTKGVSATGRSTCSPAGRGKRVFRMILGTGPPCTGPGIFRAARCSSWSGKGKNPPETAGKAHCRKKERKAMEVVVIGLGRMGANIARRLARGGHKVLVYNRTDRKRPSASQGRKAGISRGGNRRGNSLYDDGPARALWIMVPGGRGDGPYDRGGPSRFREPGDRVNRTAETANFNDPSAAVTDPELGPKGIHFVGRQDTRTVRGGSGRLSEGVTAS
jgi:hypothetical protein